MRTARLLERGKSVLAQSTRDDFVLERGQGAHVWDVDGKHYLDFVCGVASAPLGHNHPELMEVVWDFVGNGKLWHYAGNDFYSEPTIKLAETLSKLSPTAKGSKVFFSNSGTESIECAIKASYDFEARTGRSRTKLASFEHGFHGRTLGSLSLTNSRPVHTKGYPSFPVLRFPYGNCYRCLHCDDCGLQCVERIREIIAREGSDITCLFGEPVQGEGGYVAPPQKFWHGVGRICKEHGILFCADEVQSGIGRTGKLFAIENYKIKPNYTCMAKGLSGGLIPIAATVGDPEKMFQERGRHSNTFGGHQLACAIGLKVLEILHRDKLLDNARGMGAYFRKRLGEIDHPRLGAITGLGLMLGLEFVKDKKTKDYDPSSRDRFVRACWKRGLLIIGCGRSTARLMPPLTIDKQTADTSCEIIEKSIESGESRFSLFLLLSFLL
jgi:4-aminobutyrate aminotransferase